MIKRKKNYREAKLLEILEPSPDRIDPKCQHAKVCGGCSWQHVPYQKQLEYKTQQVTDHILDADHENAGCLIVKRFL